MAVTSIVITQTNTVGDNNFLPVHSPLVFIATATVTGTPPETLNVYIEEPNPPYTKLSTYKAMLLDNPTTGSYRYIFRGERALRQQMEFPNNSNVPHTLGMFQTTVYNHYKDLIIEFIDIPSTIAQSLLVRCFNAARQVGGAITLTDVYENNEEEVFCFQNRENEFYFNKPNIDEKEYLFKGGGALQEDNGVFLIRRLIEPSSYPLGRSLYNGLTTIEASVSDWWLPSRDELVLIYQNLITTGALNVTGNFWSSTEIDGEDVYYLNTGTGISVAAKKEIMNVIPCRKIVSAQAYTVGQRGQAGWVFYQYNSNTYYETTIAENVITGVDWGANGDYVGDTSAHVGTGEENTAIIVAYLNSVYETGKAAQVVTDLTLPTYSLVKNFIINTMENCPDGLYVKFLDSSTGYYRYWLFGKYYRINDSTENIGDVSVFSTHSTVIGEELQNTGVRASRKIVAIADGLTQSMLNYLSPIFTSPIIILLTDGLPEIKVKLDSGSRPVKWGKQTSGSVSVTFDLGEQFSVKML